ncbi:hypothetical protein NDU88_002254 [Pleurodeles waltl]|uniref:Reverse transcriptase domain-containing protein n=1 Tax=Pleurodeles waltl TaxID=8319 RepID=A0AAV7VE02_PLEWA|nr:hypothetical protein NDU88_002254 [Pleurodeles waltl]
MCYGGPKTGHRLKEDGGCGSLRKPILRRPLLTAARLHSMLLLGSMGHTERIPPPVLDVGAPGAPCRYDVDGKCTDPIKMIRGVRQGCVPAPFPFCLYFNDPDIWLKDEEVDSPRVGNKKLFALLYADDCVLMSRTGVGLQNC